MAFDQPCDCGVQCCHNEITLRKGPIWDYKGEEVPNWLHVEINDFRGKSMELMLSPDSARRILWWMIKNFWRKGAKRRG